MNWLRALYLRIRYPDVCWTHRRYKSGGSYGYFCVECNEKDVALFGARHAERNELLKNKYGVRHGLLR